MIEILLPIRKHDKVSLYYCCLHKIIAFGNEIRNHYIQKNYLWFLWFCLKNNYLFLNSRMLSSTMHGICTIQYSWSFLMKLKTVLTINLPTNEFKHVGYCAHQLTFVLWFYFIISPRLLEISLKWMRLVFKSIQCKMPACQYIVKQRKHLLPKKNFKFKNFQRKLKLQIMYSLSRFLLQFLVLIIPSKQSVC